MSTETQTLPVFSFLADGSAAAQPSDGAAATHAGAIDAEALQRIRRAVEAAEEATYHWVMEADEIQWSPNVEAVLHCDQDQLRTGRAYANFIDGENTAGRYEAIMLDQSSDKGSGVAFQIEYFFKPDGRAGRRGFWLEDKGKWFAGQNGRPAEVYGAVRKVDDRHNRDERLNFLGSHDPLTGMMSRGHLTEALGEHPPLAGAVEPDANPKQLYETAYGYLLQRDYASAEAAFDDFLKRHPSDPMAANAQYWLGESLYVRGQYRAAASAFLKGYQNHGKSAKAPESLLKLAMSLQRLGQKDAACSSYSELTTKYPNAPAHVRNTANAERQRNGC